MSEKKISTQTHLVHAATGHHMPELGLKIVTPPVTRGSTLLFDDCAHVDEWIERGSKTGRHGYGITGTGLTVSLETLMADLDGGTEAVATATGLSAVALALSACVQAGDHILMADNVYGPARNYAVQFLNRFGVEIGFFDPMDLATLESKIQPNTKILYFEVPGSVTFEVPDCESLYAIAKEHDLITIVDSTWPTSLYYPAIRRGADISLAAGTKYYAGHSDVFFGIVIGNERTGVHLRKQAALMGNYMSPDDIYLALRGMRTLKVRLDAISKSALIVAKFLQSHPKIAQVLHPALPSCPGHENWKEQFDGASGLFGVFLNSDYDGKSAEALVENLTLFGIGFSWGGFESLAVHSTDRAIRSLKTWEEVSNGKGALLRLQIGLEDPSDLTADLTQALDKLP